MLYYDESGDITKIDFTKFDFKIEPDKGVFLLFSTKYEKNGLFDWLNDYNGD